MTNNETRDKEIQEHADRLIRVEQAIIQINHFTESIEDLKLHEWKGDVNRDLMWIKLLMGGTTLAAIGQLILTALKGG